MQNLMSQRQLLKRKADALSEDEVAEVLEYIEVMKSLREQATRPDLLDEAMLRLLSAAMKTAQPMKRIHSRNGGAATSLTS